MKKKIILFSSLLIIPFLSIGGSYIFLASQKEKINFSKFSIVNVSSTSEEEIPLFNQFVFDKVRLYGPYPQGVGSFTFDVSIKYLGKFALETCRVKLTEWYYTDGGNERVNQYYSSYIKGDATIIPYSFTIEDLTKSITNVKIEYGIYSDQKSKYLACVCFDFDLIKEKNINPFLYKDSPYLNENSMFYANGEKEKESFLFSNFREYVVVDRYSRLLINEFFFVYSSPRTLIYKEICLYFEDTNSLFPYINEDELGYKFISLVTINNDGKHFLYPSIGMGIDTSTNEMHIPNNGFTNTNYFFIPKNSLNKIKNYKFNIRIDGLGQSNLKLDFPLSIISENYILGNCIDSDYCIVGGIYD